MNHTGRALPQSGFLVFLLLVGCSKRPTDMPLLFPCTVTVVKDGAAIETVRVQLLPAEGAGPLAAVPISIVGKTASNGVAILHTNRLGASYREKGAPAGKYLVSIEKAPRWEGEKSSEELARLSPAESMDYQQQLQEAMKTLPREVPKSLARDKKQPIEILPGTGGSLTIDVSQFRDD
jgi:hypothetical protein